MSRPTTAIHLEHEALRKSRIYAEHGVAHSWLIDPDLRTLVGFQNSEGKWLLLTTLKDREEVSLPPFDAIAFELSALRDEGAPHAVGLEADHLR
jgi:Uma2 family endonuclease